MNRRGDHLAELLKILEGLDSETELERKKIELLIKDLEKLEDLIPQSLINERTFVGDLKSLDLNSLSYGRAKAEISSICADYLKFLKNNQNLVTFKDKYLTGDGYYQNNIQEILNAGNLLSIFRSLADELDDLIDKGYYIYNLDPNKIYLSENDESKLDIDRIYKYLKQIALTNKNQEVERKYIERFDAVHRDFRPEESAIKRVPNLNRSIVNYTYLYLWFWALTPENIRSFNLDDWKHTKDNRLGRKNIRVITKLNNIKKKILMREIKNKEIFRKIVESINNFGNPKKKPPQNRNNNLETNKKSRKSNKQTNPNLKTHNLPKEQTEAGYATKKTNNFEDEIHKLKLNLSNLNLEVSDLKKKKEKIKEEGLLKKGVEVIKWCVGKDEITKIDKEIKKNLKKIKQIENQIKRRMSNVKK